MAETSYTDIASIRPHPGAALGATEQPDGAGLFIGIALGVVLWGAIFAFFLW